jgi:hypothetical protein
MFTIVLVCLENFQEYILTNIAQLIKFGHTKIYVITNNHLMQEFESLSDMIYSETGFGTLHPHVSLSYILSW